ncbi:hypothetical protein FGIG_01499 [Fasciola gigantica]|uniref:Uncharacterized protein n=1 Tax=Fasciola gigantica TaxID=46835 RepID=A0A504Y5Z1_FASGI|nr:hypothetical protein FGIG_01499 [Fasciola gigantica]
MAYGNPRLPPDSVQPFCEKCHQLDGVCYRDKTSPRRAQEIKLVHETGKGFRGFRSRVLANYGVLVLIRTATVLSLRSEENRNLCDPVGGVSLFFYHPANVGQSCQSESGECKPVGSVCLARRSTTVIANQMNETANIGSVYGDYFTGKEDLAVVNGGDRVCQCSKWAVPVYQVRLGYFICPYSITSSILPVNSGFTVPKVTVHVPGCVSCIQHGGRCFQWTESHSRTKSESIGCICPNTHGSGSPSLLNQSPVNDTDNSDCSNGERQCLSGYLDRTTSDIFPTRLKESNCARKIGE